ncbi:MAG: hypothetical protein AAFO83_16670 [Cyanobacteria bacterium J06607_13]
MLLPPATSSSCSLEQLETHDSSKSVKDINIQQVRLDALDTRDSSK